MSVQRVQYTMCERTCYGGMSLKTRPSCSVHRVYILTRKRSLDATSPCNPPLQLFVRLFVCNEVVVWSRAVCTRVLRRTWRDVYPREFESVCVRVGLRSMVVELVES